MIVRASEINPRAPLLRRRMSASDSSPSRSRSFDVRRSSRVAHLQLQARNRRRWLEGDERTPVADRHELDPLQPAEGAAWCHDDDGVVAVSGDFGGSNRSDPRRDLTLDEGDDRRADVGVNDARRARTSSGSVTVTALEGRPYFLGRPRR